MGSSILGNETHGNMLREVLVLSHKNSYGLSHARPKDITLYQRLTVNKWAMEKVQGKLSGYV